MYTSIPLYYLDGKKDILNIEHNNIIHKCDSQFFLKYFHGGKTVIFNILIRI